MGKNRPIHKRVICYVLQVPFGIIIDEVEIVVREKQVFETRRNQNLFFSGNAELSRL